MSLKSASPCLRNDARPGCFKCWMKTSWRGMSWWHRSGDTWTTLLKKVANLSSLEHAVYGRNSCHGGHGGQLQWGRVCSAQYVVLVHRPRHICRNRTPRPRGANHDEPPQLCVERLSFSFCRESRWTHFPDLHMCIYNIYIYMYMYIYIYMYHFYLHRIFIPYLSFLQDEGPSCLLSSISAGSWAPGHVHPMGHLACNGQRTTGSSPVLAWEKGLGDHQHVTLW